METGTALVRALGVAIERGAMMSADEHGPPNDER
jgi:hypothetical protein